WSSRSAGRDRAAPSPLTPALLIRMDRGPSAASAWSMAAPIASASMTSRGDGDGLASGGADGGDLGVEPVRTARGQGGPGPGGGQDACESQAEAAGRAGDEDGAVFQRRLSHVTVLPDTSF